MITISTHAVLRWIERVDHADVHGARMLCRQRGWPASDGNVLQCLAEMDEADPLSVRDMLRDRCAALAIPAMGEHTVPLKKAVLVVYHGTLVTVNAKRKQGGDIGRARRDRALRKNKARCERELDRADM